MGKNVEFVVNASASEVNQKLHQMGDYGKASKDLTTINVQLKTSKPSLSQPSGVNHAKGSHLLRDLPKLGSALESPKGVSYDGMGGHSKSDEFPVPRINKINTVAKSKKPKGISRPAKLLPSSLGERQIDSFFSSV